MTASAEIDGIIAKVDDWRGPVLKRMRAWIREVDPDLVEEVKWRKPTNPDGVPVWSRDGIICTGETYKGKVKLTFANGAKLDDPSGLFNGSMGGNTMRAIDISEDMTVDEAAFKALVRAAIAFNQAKAGAKK